MQMNTFGIQSSVDSMIRDIHRLTFGLSYLFIYRYLIIEYKDNFSKNDTLNYGLMMEF